MTVITFTEHIDQPRLNGAAHGSMERLGLNTKIISARKLGAKVFPPIKFIVPAILPEGATLLAGRPKLGKSWMALDIALAVARGDYTLGDYHCSQGDVLYLALEDNQRRLQSRIGRITVSGSAEPFPERLDLATEWPRCDAGGIEAIRAWASSKQAPRLAVVDVLAMFKPSRGTQESNYEHDYAAVKGLQELASELGIGVLIVHHVRKGVGDIDSSRRSAAPSASRGRRQRHDPRPGWQWLHPLLPRA